MKKLIGWILFYLGLFIVQLIFTVPAIMGFEPEITTESLYIILPAIACFIGWFFLAFLPGRRENKELDAMHKEFLEREKKAREYKEKYHSKNNSLEKT